MTDDFNKERYDELTVEIEKINEYLDTKEYKDLPQSQQNLVIKNYLLLADEQNSIKKYSHSKRLKIKVIREIMESIEVLEHLKVTNYQKYLRLKQSFQNKIDKMKGKKQY